MAYKNRPNWRQILEGIEECGGNITAYAKEIGFKRRIVSYWHKEALIEQDKELLKKELGVFDKKTYVITSAQIKTKVHEGFLRNLELFAEVHDAEIMIPGITYNTNDGSWNGGMGDSKKKTQQIYFDQNIRQYLMNDRIKLNEKVELIENC